MRDDKFDIGNELSEEMTFTASHPLSTCETVKLKLSTISDMYSAKDPSYLIEPILHLNTVNLITGYAGTGKSLIVLLIAYSLLTGKSFLDVFPVNEIGPVLIVDEENPPPFIKDRLSKFGFTEDLDLSFIHFQSVKVDEPEIFNDLIEMIKEVKPVLVVFDALIRFHSGKESCATDMNRVMQRFRDIVNAIDTTVLIVHHNRKGQGDGKESARGSSDIVGAVDNQLCLSSGEGDTLTLSSGKTRMAPFRPINFKIDSDADSLKLTYLGREVYESEELIGEILNILDGVKLGAEQIKKELDDRGYSTGINKVRSLLKHATGKELQADTEARGKLAYSVNASFTASHPLRGQLNCEPEKSNLDSFTREGELNCEPDNQEIIEGFI